MQDAKWDFCTLNWLYTRWQLSYYWARYDFFSYLVHTTMVNDQLRVSPTAFPEGYYIKPSCYGKGERKFRFQGEGGKIFPLQLIIPVAIDYSRVATYHSRRITSFPLQRIIPVAWYHSLYKLGFGFETGAPPNP